MYIYVKQNENQLKTAIIRREHFNAAHRLHNKNWSDARNQEVFGKCNNPNYHGHNYDLEVKVIGDVDESTGYVMDTKLLKELIQVHVTDVYDHKNLNLDVPAFHDLNPTAENIARIIYETLRAQLTEDLQLKIVLYETARNSVEYPAY